MRELSQVYDELLDRGITISELYTYHRLITSELAYGMSEGEILDKVQDILNRFSCDPDCRSLDEHIDMALNDEEDEDE